MITNYWYPGTWFGIADQLCLPDGKVMAALNSGWTTYGTSGIDEPLWPTRVGQQVQDNGITWTCIKETPMPVIMIQQDSIFKPEPEPKLVLLDPDYIEEREV